MRLRIFIKAGLLGRKEYFDEVLPRNLVRWLIIVRRSAAEKDGVESPELAGRLIFIALFFDSAPKVGAADE